MRSGRFWPCMILGLLGLNVTVVGVTLYLATSDDSFAVEPDYYQKAVDWDRSRASARDADELGWSLDVTIGAIDDAGNAAITLRLRDAEREPVPRAAVRIEAFHSGRASHRLDAILAEGSPGVYIATLPLERAGLWRLSFTALRVSDSITTTIDRDVPRTGVAP